MGRLYCKQPGKRSTAISQEAGGLLNKWHEGLVKFGGGCDGVVAVFELKFAPAASGSDPACLAD